MSQPEPPLASSPRRLPPWVVFTAKLVVSSVLLVILFRYADMGSVLQRLRGAALLPLAAAFVLLGAQIAVSATKWRMILRADGLDVEYPTLLRLNATGSFLSLFLPSSFGGDLYRAVALRSQAKGLVRSTASVVFDRGSGLFALLTIAAVSYQFYPGSRYAGLVGLIWLAIVAGFVVFTSDLVLGLRAWQRARPLEHLRTLLATIRLYSRSGRILLAILGLSLLFQLMMVVINWFYAEALGIEIPFPTLLVIIPLIYLTEVIPLSINGIGIRDGAFVAAFAAVGLPAEQALAMSLTLISMRYAFGFLCGGIVLAVSLKTKPAAPTNESRA